MEKLCTQNPQRKPGKQFPEVPYGVSMRDSSFPGMPLVMGEGVTWCGHPGMRWEEKSDVFWSLIKYNSGLLKRNGYWGCVSRTQNGPDDPSWTEYPDRLRHANEFFLSPP